MLVMNFWEIIIIPQVHQNKLFGHTGNFKNKVFVFESYLHTDERIQSVLSGRM